MKNVNVESIWFAEFIRSLEGLRTTPISCTLNIKLKGISASLSARGLAVLWSFCFTLAIIDWRVLAECGFCRAFEVEAHVGCGRRDQPLALSAAVGTIGRGVQLAYGAS